MTQIGKDFRLSQIINNKSKKQVCVAMDHSPAIGPCEGFIDPVETIRKVCQGNPDTIFTHFGNIKKAMPVLIEYQVPFLLSISTATILGPDPTRVYLIDTVTHAVQIGACGVSMRIFVGSDYEHEMIGAMSQVAIECENLGMPLMAMMYPYGMDNIYDPKVVKHAARIGAELGSDIVKTYYTGDPDSFAEVTESCPVPVVMSGGPKADDPVDFLKSLRGAMDGGALGVAVGRNIWQHENPAKMLKAVNLVVHENLDAETAYKNSFL